MIRLFPVIVETDLADRHDLPGLCQHTEFGKFFLVKLRRAARMDTCCPIDKRIFFRQGNRRLRAFHIRADIDDRADPACCQTGKKLFPVPVKRLIIVMSVCIKYHISYIPFFLSRSPHPPASLSPLSSGTAFRLHPRHTKSCPRRADLPISPVLSWSQP